MQIQIQTDKHVPHDPLSCSMSRRPAPPSWRISPTTSPASKCICAMKTVNAAARRIEPAASRHTSPACRRSRPPIAPKPPLPPSPAPRASCAPPSNMRVASSTPRRPRRRRTCSDQSIRATAGPHCAPAVPNRKTSARCGDTAAGRFAKRGGGTSHCVLALGRRCLRHYLLQPCVMACACATTRHQRFAGCHPASKASLEMQNIRSPRAVAMEVRS